MVRTPQLSRTDMSTEAQQAADHIVASRGQLSGPFTVLLHDPLLARRVADVGASIRFDSDLPDRITCLAAILTARAYDCRFEWAGWVRHARDAGVSETLVSAIRDQGPMDLDELEPDEVLVVRAGEQLLGQHRLGAELYDALLGHFGTRGIVDLVATFGYFSMLSYVLNSFEVEPPADGDVLPVAP